MSDFFKILENTNLSTVIENTNLSTKLKSNGVQTALDLHKKIMCLKILGDEATFPYLNDNEINILNENYHTFLEEKDLIPKKKKQKTINSTFETKSLTNSLRNQTKINTRTQPKRSIKDFDKETILFDRENELKKKLSKVRLIGEVDLSKELIYQIGNDLKSYFYTCTKKDGLEIIAVEFPSTFLVFLVGMTIYHYDEKGIWPEINEKLGLNSPNNLGPTFEKLLNQFGFPRFPNLQEKSMRYVTPMALHCGIPIHCLPDYFQYVIIPSIHRPEYAGLEGETLIEELLESNSVKHTTDKPIQYFLEYGGQTAVDGLHRAKRMAISWLKDKTVYTPEQIGLPPHIVSFFYEWTKNNPGLILNKHQKSTTKLVKPDFCYDPWGLGLFFRLPEQKFQTFNSDNIYWEILYDENKIEQVKTRVRDFGDYLQTSEILYRLDKVSNHYTIKFHIDNRDYTWNFIGINEQNPYLLFNPDRDPATLLREFSNREIWVVRPNHIILDTALEKGIIIEEFPDLFGEFEEFISECWDLSELQGFILQNDNKNINIQFKALDNIPQPKLIGGFPYNTVLNENGDPIYLGMAPELFIPIHVYEDQKDLWIISIIPGENSTLIMKAEQPLNTINNSAIRNSNNNGIILNLNHEDLLGKNPFGQFHIHVRGPLGMDADFNLTIFSDLKIFGNEKLHFPTENFTSPIISTYLHVSNQDQIRPMEKTCNSLIPLGGGKYESQYGPDNVKLDLLYTHQDEMSRLITQKFSVLIKRVRWQLVVGHVVDESWHNTPFQIPMHLLEGEITPFMILDYPSENEDNPEINLEVIDVSGQALTESRLIKAPQSNKQKKRFWRIDLSFLHDLIRLSTTPSIRVKLRIKNNPQTLQEKILPLISISKKLDINITNYEVFDSGESYNLTLHWVENFHFCNRILYIKSICQPWLKAHKEYIPDSAVETCQLTIPKEKLTGSLYKLHFDIYDPWITEENSDEIFNNIKGEHYRLKFKEPISRLIELNKYPNQLSIQDHLEIYLTQKEDYEKSPDLKQLLFCIDHIQDIDLVTFRVLFEQIELTKDESIKHAFSNALNSPLSIQKLLNFSNYEFVEIDELNKYLSYLPKPNDLSLMSCQLLLNFPSPKYRNLAAIQLLDQDKNRAIKAIINAWENGIFPNHETLHHLYDHRNLLESLQINPESVKNLRYQLEKYNPYTGLQEVKIGTWVLTNAGWGRIDQIINKINKEPVNSFFEGEDIYRIHLLMHEREMLGIRNKNYEIAEVDMVKNTIHFPGKNRLLICSYCNEFATTYRNLFINHISEYHPGKDPYPIFPPKNTIELKKLEFNYQNKHTGKEL
ncbi:MAG: hypothetical protein CL609_24150 [Anaerolineaceae bacterium]|nr:hypothetical protein [Anaerolineaceae bacterium]